MSPDETIDNVRLECLACEGADGDTRLADLLRGAPAFDLWRGARRRGGPDAPALPPEIYLATRAPTAGEAVATTDLPRQADWRWRGNLVATVRAGPAGPSLTSASGLLCNMTDIAPGAEDEFNDWYDTEHVPLLMQDPGAVAAYRFHANSGTPRYLALYYLTQPVIAQTPEWGARAMTPWARRIGRFRTNNQRWLMHRI